MKKQLLLLTVLLTSVGVMAQTYFSDNFEGGTLTANNAWTSQIVVDTDGTGAVWQLGTIGGNYAKMSNYITAANHEMDVWFISPSFDLSSATTPTMGFDMTKRYAGDDIVVHISTDYDGSSAPSTATWADITSLFTLDANTGSWAFVPSGYADISSYVTGNPATTYIAFQYLGTAIDGSTWQIDNITITEGAPVVPDVSIFDIQNTGSYAGQTVNTGGIVTGVFSNGANVGYFIQAGTGAWTGIYVDDATNVPSRGDSLTLTGVISEAFGNTQLGSVSNYTVVSSANAEPASTSVSTANANMEDYEGVKVTVNSATCTDPNLGFGEWVVNDGSDTVVVDDLMYAFSPVMGNDYDITGPVYYSYGAPKIEPRDMNDIVGAAMEYTIYDCQYTTDPGGVSPYNGVSVTVKGIVYAESNNAFNANDRGYWIMDGTGPWSGIFVWDSVNVVSRGDSVEVSAQVNENFNQTILRNVSNVTILNSGNTEPAASVITSDDANTEPYEGVLVEVTNANCTNPAIGFGQWSINNATMDVLVDDVMYEFLTPVLNGMYRVTGPLYYTYSEYKILPRDMNDVEELLGVNEVSIENLEIYPNPSKGTVNLNNQGEEVLVFNAIGELILTTTNSTFNLESGVYIVKVGNASTRVIIL